jgi:hypothetical protein
MIVWTSFEFWYAWNLRWIHVFHIESKIELEILVELKSYKYARCNLKDSRYMLCLIFIL